MINVLKRVVFFFWIEITKSVLVAYSATFPLRINLMKTNKLVVKIKTNEPQGCNNFLKNFLFTQCNNTFVLLTYDRNIVLCLLIQSFSPYIFLKFLIYETNAPLRLDTTAEL